MSDALVYLRVFCSWYNNSLSAGVKKLNVIGFYQTLSIYDQPYLAINKTVLIFQKKSQFFVNI